MFLCKFLLNVLSRALTPMLSMTCTYLTSAQLYFNICASLTFGWSLMHDCITLWFITVLKTALTASDFV